MVRSVIITIILMAIYVASPIPDIGAKLELPVTGYVVVEGEFTDAMSAQFANDISKIKGNDVYVYINSPGGSVPSLLDMIKSMKASKKNFTCVAKTAYSAGFILLQYCDNRYMLSDGMIMTHFSWVIINDTIEGAYEFIMQYYTIEKQLDEYVSNRLKMSVCAYKALKARDLYMNAETAMKYNAIDGIMETFATKQEQK